MALSPEEVRFSELAIAQGLCSPAQVRECIDLIERLLAEGVTPVPRLGELLARKGYLSPAGAEATLKAATGAARPPEGDLPPEAALAAKEPSNTVGKYVKVARLGAGGMGEVWKAWDGGLSRWVALKFLKYDDPAEQARFLREARTAAALNHPNIAAVYESGHAAGRPYLAMQFVDGATLAAFPRNDVRRLASLVRDAALAIHHAHERFVIHRDLKPSNLMVEDGRIYVLDFGLAKQTSVDSSLSLSGAILGTPAYMAPEQARGDAARVGPRSDVYALGATLYELLADRPPFLDTDVYALLKRVVDDDAVPLRRRSARADRDLETIVMKCLEKDPDRRYATARELAEDLERYLEGQAIRAHPPSALYRLRKFAARRKAVLSLGAAAALTVAVLVPVWLRERAERRMLAELSELRGRVIVVKEWFRQPFRKPQEIRDALAREVRALSRFIEEHPDLPHGYYVRAHALFLQNRLEPTEEDLREALRLEPAFSPGWTLLARVKYEQYEDRRMGGFSEEARQAHRAAAKPLLEESRTALARGWKEGSDRASLERWGLVRTSDDFECERLAQMLAEHHIEGKPDLSRRTLLAAQETVPSEEFCRWLALLAPDPAEKERWLDHAVRMAPNSPAVWIARAMDRLERTRFDEAVSDFDAALAIDSESVDALLGRAVVHAMKGETDRVLEDCVRAVAADPRSANARSNCSAARIRLNDLDGAERDASEAIRLDPRYPLGWINRAGARLRKRNLEGALADAGKAIDLDTGIPLAYANRAAARMEGGDRVGALLDVEKALALDPSTAAALVTRSGLKLLDRDWAGAEADAARAIDLDPREPNGWSNRAAARCEKGDPHGGLADASRAIELNPGLALAHSNRGLARFLTGDFDEALVDLTKSIELDAGLPMAYVNRSTVRLLKDDYDGAVADASRALALNPDLAAAWAARADARRWKKEFQDGLADAEKALALDSRPPEFHVIRGVLQGELGRYDRAVADLEQALHRAPPEWRLRTQVLAWLDEARRKGR